MAVMAFVPAVARGIIDVIGHFIAGVGDEILSASMIASAGKIDSEAGCKGSSKCGECDGL